MKKIKKNISLSKFTTFRVGGSAEYFLEVETPEEIISGIEWAKKNKSPYVIIAGGSNVVFPDGKTKGLVIRVSGGKIKRNGNFIITDAGVPLMDVVRFSTREGLSGLEKLSGIPGTVGGAVYGNAGAYGASISESISNVIVYDGKNIKTIPHKKCDFRYRTSGFKKKKAAILSVVLKLKKADPCTLRSISEDILGKRGKKYPKNLKCPGSFFKNILVKDVSKSALKKINPLKIIEGKIPAGYLLEEIGAKSMRVGKIKVSSYHGNLIVNEGGGTARDAKKLADILQKKVRAKFGIALKPEVMIF